MLLQGETECYDCLPHSKPKVYPVCTIRSTPSKPIHCVVWSKSYLFNQLFGAGDEDESETVEEASADLEELAKLRKEAQALKELREKAGSESYAQLVFEKVRYLIIIETLSYYVDIQCRH